MSLMYRKHEYNTNRHCENKEKTGKVWGKEWGEGGYNEVNGIWKFQWNLEAKTCPFKKVSGVWHYGIASEATAWDASILYECQFETWLLRVWCYPLIISGENSGWWLKWLGGSPCQHRKYGKATGSLLWHGIALDVTARWRENQQTGHFSVTFTLSL